MGTGGDLSITDEGSSDEEGPACGYCYGCRKNRGWCTHDGVPVRDDAAEAEVVAAVQAAAAATATTAVADGSRPAGDSCTFSPILVLGCIIRVLLVDEVDRRAFNGFLSAFEFLAGLSRDGRVMPKDLRRLVRIRKERNARELEPDMSLADKYELMCAYTNLLTEGGVKPTINPLVRLFCTPPPSSANELAAPPPAPTIGRHYRPPLLATTPLHEMWQLSITSFGRCSLGHLRLTYDGLDATAHRQRGRAPECLHPRRRYPSRD